MRFLRTQHRNSRIWSDWKYNGLLPLVTLALRRPEEALQWLLSQLPRYSSCGICGNELKGLALIARGQKSLFPLWPALHHLFHYDIYWCRDTLKGNFGFYVCPFMVFQFYCGQEYIQDCAQAPRRWIFPLVILVWEAFWKATLLHPGWHQRKSRNQEKVLMVSNWTSIWDAIRSTPGSSLSRLTDRMEKASDETPVLVRDRLTPAREGSLGGRPISIPIYSKGGHLG